MLQKVPRREWLLEQVNGLLEETLAEDCVLGVARDVKRPHPGGAELHTFLAICRHIDARGAP